MKGALMSAYDSFYRSKVAETIEALGGGRITLEEAAAHAPRPEVKRTASQGMFGSMDASEVLAAHRPLSGSNEVRTTMRGNGWGPQDRPDESPAVGYRYTPLESCPAPRWWDIDTLKRQGVVVIE
jgi:hypothetical protein